MYSDEQHVKVCYCKNDTDVLMKYKSNTEQRWWIEQ